MSDCDWPEHAGRDCIHKPVTANYDAYYQLTAAVEPVADEAGDIEPPPEWREPPGCPGYLMHSATRELWSQARTVTTKDGKRRHYAARLITPSSGRLSLSVGGVRFTRGVNALWRETFPDAEQYARLGRYARVARRCRAGHPLGTGPSVTYWGSWNRVCILCFPDFGEPGQRRRKDSAGRAEYDPAVLADGVGEWLAGGGVGIVTRPR